MSARDLVTTRIARQVRNYPELDISSLETEGLDARDGALARAIEHAVLRRWLTLAAVIDTRLDQDWNLLQANVKAPLLVGAAQLFLLERLPDHAVINEAVNWSKKHARTKSGGLVNAVLRRLAELRDTIVDEHDPQRPDELPLADGRAWRLKEEVFGDDPTKRLARQTSHPSDLIGHWISAFGRAKAQSLASHSLVHAPIIVTGLDEASAEADDRLEPHEQPGFHVYTGPHHELVDLLEQSPGARVQDPTAGEAVEATRQMNPSVIIDYCAGVGTKSAQLLAAHPQARLISTDRNPVRLGILRQALGDHERVEVVEFDRIREHAGRADLLLLDVPCSNSGVLARRVEAKYRLSASSIEQLSAIQRQIVADSLTLLAPEGRLLYATCSIETSENQQQAQWITTWHPFRVLSAARRMPRGEPGGPPRAYRDGGFFALFEPAG